MAPKKKKTKEEIEAENARLEEEARKEREEQLKREQEEQERQEQERIRRAEIAEAQLAKEQDRIAKDNELLADFFLASNLAREKHLKETLAAEDWERYLSVTPLPAPTSASAMNDFFKAKERDGAGLAAEPRTSLESMEDMMRVVDEVERDAVRAAQLGHGEQVAAFSKYHTDLFQAITRTADRMTAWIMHHCDLYADKDWDTDPDASNPDDVEVAETLGRFKWGIWMNWRKNARRKDVNYPALHVHVDIPRQLALAPIAIRIQVKDTAQEYFHACTNDLMAIGEVLLVDLLQLPPKRVRIDHNRSRKDALSWQIRAHGPFADSVHSLPYPIPPAGADPATWVSDEEVPPVTFATDIKPNLVLLADAPLQLGMWDRKAQCWTMDKIGDVSQGSNGGLTFTTSALGAFAVVCSRCRMLPYHGWSIRPREGERGDAVSLSLDVGVPGMPIDFEVWPGSVSLKGPRLAQVAPLLGLRMQPIELLLALKKVGLFLLPEERDAELVDVVVKSLDIEKAMCEDVAQLGGTHLIASSKWTQYVGGEECICRISEITDWELGGRTSAEDVERVFAKEFEAGPGKVHTVVRRGLKGVAFSKALNRCNEYPEFPEYEDDRCGTCIWGEVHAHLLALLRAEFEADLIDEVTIDIQWREEEELKKKKAETKRMAELEEYAKKGEKPPEELMQEYQIKEPERPLYYPTDWPKVAEGLKPHPETLPRAHDFSPLTSQTLAQLMLALRLFSFSVM